MHTFIYTYKQGTRKIALATLLNEVQHKLKMDKPFNERIPSSNVYAGFIHDDEGTGDDSNDTDDSSSSSGSI